MQTQAMASYTLTDSSAVIIRCLDIVKRRGLSFGKPASDKIVIYNHQQDVAIVVYDIRDDSAGPAKTTWLVDIHTYTGWKVYMELTGCFASQPDYESALDNGYDTPI